MFHLFRHILRSVTTKYVSKFLNHFIFQHSKTLSQRVAVLFVFNAASTMRWACEDANVDFLSLIVKFNRVNSMPKYSWDESICIRDKRCYEQGQSKNFISKILKYRVIVAKYFKIAQVTRRWLVWLNSSQSFIIFKLVTVNGFTRDLIDLST
jgi:hypothetical protein